jgi:hypothetical protein
MGKLEEFDRMENVALSIAGASAIAYLLIHQFIPESTERDLALIFFQTVTVGATQAAAFRGSCEIDNRVLDILWGLSPILSIKGPLGALASSVFNCALFLHARSKRHQVEAEISEITESCEARRAELELALKELRQVISTFRRARAVAPDIPDERLERPVEAQVHHAGQGSDRERVKKATEKFAKMGQVESSDDPLYAG